jgi:CRP/FNR family transcriptional regulator, cyclic AMP receptor protein
MTIAVPPVEMNVQSLRQTAMIEDAQGFVAGARGIARPTHQAPTAQSMNDDPIAVLRQVPLFAELPDEELTRLASMLRRRTFRRGEVIFHRGDPAGALHIVSAGRVKVSRPSEDGNETVLALMGAGACFGELAALDGGLRSATVTAVEQTETRMLLRDDVVNLARSSPDLAMALVRTLADRIRRTDDWLDDAYFADLDTRLANRLLELAEAHGQETADGVVVHFPLTQSDLAGMLGATRARVNRMLGIYQDAGLLRLGSGTFTILDVDGVEDRAAR